MHASSSAVGAFPRAPLADGPIARLSDAGAAVPPVFLSGIGHALPAHRITQEDAAAVADRVFGDRFPEAKRLAGVFASAGIGVRALAMPPEWYLAARGWGERNHVFVAAATELFVTAARRALTHAACPPEAVDMVVFVSSTGIATPTIDAIAAPRLGLRANVLRLPLFGLGCAGGIAGLQLGTALARAQAGATILVVAIELCSLAFRIDKLSKANVVATALFGDGAAAALIRSAPVWAGAPQPLALLGAASQHLWPDSLALMGWEIEDAGLGVVFDRTIPAFLSTEAGPTLNRMLAQMSIDPAAVDRFLFHPGGAKVLSALEGALALPAGSLDHERAVLAQAGNMSSPTVLMVLERLLAAGMPTRCVATALGPGFTAAAIELRRPA